LNLVDPKISEFISKFSPTLTLYLAPYAHQVLASTLVDKLPPTARLCEASVGAVLTEPGIVILTPADLSGPGRQALLSLTQLMRPARPILYGGTSDRDALLDAINNWRVMRVLPEDCTPAELLAAARRSHETLTVDVILNNAATELARESEKLEATIGDLRAARQQLLHTERLSTVGRIADGLIAAIRQHLKSLEKFEQTMSPACDDEELRDTLQSAFEGMRSIGTLLDEIHAYVRNVEQTYELSAEPLDDVVSRVVKFAQFDELARSRTIDVDLQADASVRINRHRLYQVLINLMRNAFQASEDNDVIAVRTRRDGDQVLIEVEDPGTGMPADVLAQIFEPFFTTKGDHGMGLGLSVSRVAIERQAGQISCVSTLGVGTTFTITLPAAG
jgi:signal transduction histidine kinase